MTKRSCVCDCKEMIIQLLEGHKEQSRLLAAQNEVMGKLVDQNTELMNQLLAEEERDLDQLKTLD